jgi:hypothetical protein
MLETVFVEVAPAKLVEKNTWLVASAMPSGATSPDARILRDPPLVVPLDELLPTPLELELLDEDPLDVEPLDAEPLEVEPVDVELLDEGPLVPEEDELVAPPVPWPPLASWYLPKS